MKKCEKWIKSRKHTFRHLFVGGAIDQSIDSWWFLLGFSPPHELTWLKVPAKLLAAWVADDLEKSWRISKGCPTSIKPKISKHHEKWIHDE
jgi:hypothetical protein